MRAPLAFLALILLMGGLPGEAAADPVVAGSEHCVINVRSDDALNLRSGPGTGHSVLARLPYARCGVMVTGACAGSWCPVEDGHDAGWVHRHFIAAVSAEQACLSASAPREPALRAWPSEQSRVLVRLTSGSCGIALLPYRVEGWQKVRQGGWEGWVRQSDLRSVDG